MKKILLAIFVLLSFGTSTKAYDYAYLVLQKADGSTVSLSTSGISISVSGTTITIDGTAYEAPDLRFMYFTNSTSPENVVSIPSIGWATFCSSQALDYSSVEGLTAYTAQFGTSTADLSSLSAAVPAETGVILKGEEGTYHVPVVSSASAPASNDLLGTISDLTTTSSYSYYALAQIDDSSVGFKRVKTGVVIPAGKAYYTTSASSVRSYYSFGDIDDSSTGIMKVSPVDNTNGDTRIYDLQGRMVDNPTRGLYIKNGKKYIIK